MIKFGKTSSTLLSQKQSFFDNNDEILAESKRIGNVYLSQPRRRTCKCCDKPLDGKKFTKHSIGYIICDVCTHLNGMFEDTDEFCRSLYTDYGGASYAVNYSAEDHSQFQERVKHIYLPKAQFLFDSLKNLNEAAENMKMADFGAGSGYFVTALRMEGIKNSNGYEVSDTQIRLANEMLGQGAVIKHEMNETVDIAKNIDAEVVTMVGVLEHLQNPRDVLAALAGNPNVNYLFVSVPLFSPCVIIESVFPNVMQRQLSSGHTHLYTEKSLEWMRGAFGLESVSAWWFGTDIVDLFRSVSVELNHNSQISELGEFWNESIIASIDEMQMSLDKRKMSSEVHMLMKFV